MSVQVDVIPLSDGGVIFKRGVREVVLRGETVGTIVGPLSDLVRSPDSADAILSSLPDDESAQVQQAFEHLRNRGVVAASEPSLASVPAGQEAFYSEFGTQGVGAADRISTARIAVLGDNAISRTAVESLTSMGVRDVTVVADPPLSSNGAPHSNNGKVGTVASLDDVDVSTLDCLCATSDIGEVDALLDANRVAIDAGVVFIPAWLANLQGYVGPLVHPGETACLRCYRLRADSNDASRDMARAVRRHVSNTADERVSVSLTPMTAVVGHLLAMEVVKHVGGFAPSDVVGKSMQVNLVSFRSAVSRVLKVPRCPDCAEIMQRSPEVIIVGPQITE